MQIDTEDLKVQPGKKTSLKECDSGWIPKWAKKQEDKEGKKAVKEQALAILENSRQKLIEMQELFWATITYSMLIVLQGMDAAGKDSTIAHVMSGVNPQGCHVTSFKTPSEEELNHDFLWRHAKALPEKGPPGMLFLQTRNGWHMHRFLRSLYPKLEAWT
jgi:polyphosphate kinase 2 (PPK2 family)